MNKYCQACGMPLTKKEDFAGGDESANFCLYCVDDNGKVKDCKKIFNGGVQFFISQIGGSRELAEKLTRKNMLRLPYWKDKDCDALKGDVASDEEFANAMKAVGENPE